MTRTGIIINVVLAALCIIGIGYGSIFTKNMYLVVVCGIFYLGAIISLESARGR